MLLFIQNPIYHKNIHQRFNTSHVTLYRQQKHRKTERKYVSIHLMLLFITDLREKQRKRIFVSIHLMLLFIGLRIRNASLHLVSIHLMLLFIKDGGDMGKGMEPFQYISCYSLSVKRHKLAWFRSMFQYISCYSLSKKKK